MFSWSLLMPCPYHLNVPSLIFILNHSTLIVPLMYSFLILSFLIISIANLNIFISATSISSTCFFVTATISSPYTTKLHTFLTGNSCHRLLLTPFSICSILPAVSSLPPSHNDHFLHL